jgi:hypothetical protein
MLRPSVIKEIDKVARRCGLTRSQLMGMYIEYALKEMRVIKL